MSEQAQKKNTGWWVAPFLMVFGFGATALNWYTVLTDNFHDFSAAPVTPFIGFLGLAMLVAPEVEKAPEGPILPPGYLRSLRRNLARGLVAFGLIASVANLALMSGWRF